MRILPVMTTKNAKGRCVYWAQLQMRWIQDVESFFSRGRIMIILWKAFARTANDQVETKVTKELEGK